MSITPFAVRFCRHPPTFATKRKGATEEMSVFSLGHFQKTA
jgi:hypothetical protein